MEAQASIASASGDRQKKNFPDKLPACEVDAAMYHKIKAIRGKYHSGGFTLINVPLSWPVAHSDLSNTQALPDPKQATKWKTTNLPDKIMYYLLLCNRQHFGQAHGTPFTLPQFKTKIDWMASMETSELILNGDFDSSKLSDMQALILQHCRSSTLNITPLYIMIDELISKFKSWNERTSTSHQDSISDTTKH
jgi:hypothetical protein